jgi:hypothetical protein
MEAVIHRGPADAVADPGRWGFFPAPLRQGVLARLPDVPEFFNATVQVCLEGEVRGFWFLLRGPEGRQAEPEGRTRMEAAAVEHEPGGS